MTLWQSITWDTARAAGFTSYALLTISVALGLALSGMMQSPRWPRIINSELHNFLTLLALVFTVIHVAAVWVDPFTTFGWNEVFIPFASHYRPLWMAFGIAGFYLGLALAASVLIRPLIGYTWWRRLHVFTLGVYALVTVHGIATGSDTRTWWGLAIYAGSVLLVGSLLAIRLLVPATPRGKPHPLLAGLAAAAALAGLFWAMAGPLQAGWNAVANNGQGSGSRVALAEGSTSSNQSNTTSTASSAADPFASGFQSYATGSMSQTGPDANGATTLDIQMTIQGQTPGTVRIQLQGQQASAGQGVQVTTTSVTLARSDGTVLYRGQVTRLSTREEWRITATLTPLSGNGSDIQLRMELKPDANGQVRAEVQGTPGTSNGTNSDSSEHSGEFDD